MESEDFDIVQAAQGVEKVVVKEFKVVVKNKTLEVRFHWAGKGTTAIPSEELMVLSYQLFLWNLVSLGHKSGVLRDCITWGKGFQYLWGLPL